MMAVLRVVKTAVSRRPLAHARGASPLPSADLVAAVTSPAGVRDAAFPIAMKESVCRAKSVSSPR